MPFAMGAVREIPNDADDVYAFEVNGTFDAETSEALAEYMNRVFDEKDTVHMMFDLSGFEGREGADMFSGEVLKNRLRSVANIGRYAVVGAPEAARRMIEAMDKIVPVDARTFDAGERDAAWTFLGARPL